MTQGLISVIKDQLANNEEATNEELVTYFIEEGATEEEAKTWIAKRSFYHLNIVVQDEAGNDIGIYDAKTGSVKPLS